MCRKNEENARLEMEKKVFYGPRRYSLPMYLQYELTRFRLDFVQPTENIRKSGISPEITENQKKLSMNGIKIYLEDILEIFFLMKR